MKPVKLALCALSFFAVTACSDKKDDQPQQGGRPAAGSAVAADPAARSGGGAGSPGGGGPGGGAPGGGGRRGMSVTLAAADVATVDMRVLERGVAITGDLRPIERVEIRARLEGDLDGVFVREGQRVGAGTLLARFESFEEQSAVASAKADRAAVSSALSTAQWNADQSMALLKEGAIPEQDARASQQQVATARAQLAAADARLRSATASLNDTRVVAPVSGVIETRTVSPGEHLSRGAPIFTLVRNDVLELAAALPSSQAGGVAPGQTVRFTVGNRGVLGRVARISPTVDPASRSITVYVQVPNRDGTLMAGTFASGRLITSTSQASITIPSAALRFSANSADPFVYRISGGTLEQAPIQVGYTDESAGIIEVVSGLKAGDRIVVGNVGTLGKGMKVQVIGGEKNGSGRPAR